MSYYVTWEIFNLRSKYTPNEMETFEDLFYAKYPCLNGEYIRRYKEDGTFEMNECCLNSDDDEDVLFIQFLSEYFTGEMFLTGEEQGDYQRIKMQANGKYKIESGAIYYGDLIDEILEYYDLPENLKTELLNYKTARKI